MLVPNSAPTAAQVTYGAPELHTSAVDAPAAIHALPDARQRRHTGHPRVRVCASNPVAVRARLLSSRCGAVCRAGITVPVSEPLLTLITPRSIDSLAEVGRCKAGNTPCSISGRVCRGLRGQATRGSQSRIGGDVTISIQAQGVSVALEQTTSSVRSERIVGDLPWVEDAGKGSAQGCAGLVQAVLRPASGP